MGRSPRFLSQPALSSLVMWGKGLQANRRPRFQAVVVFQPDGGLSKGVSTRLTQYTAVGSSAKLVTRGLAVLCAGSMSRVGDTPPAR
jgi:hypothetical protein